MLRVEIWIATTLFSVGIIAGMTYLNFVNDAPVPIVAQQGTESSHDDDMIGMMDDWDGNSSNASDNSKSANPSGKNQKSAVNNGDRYLLAGNFATALEYYAEFDRTVADGGTAILLREAICHERQKQYIKAQEKYNRTIKRATNENHHLLAISGYARCLLREGRQNEALEILAHQTLKIDQYAGVPNEIRAQFVFQFAKALESHIVEPSPDLTSLNSVTFEEFSLNLETLIDIIDQPASSLNPHSDASDEFSITVIQRPTNSLNVIMVTISANLEPVLVSVAQIASVAKLELRISQQAKSVLENRSKTIDIHTSPLSSVLDRLLVGFDLTWHQDGSELHVMTQKELTASNPANQFWFATSLRAFRRFELEFPDGERRSASLLSRANLNLIQKKYDIAANYYQELIQSQPKEEVLAKMFFNLAKLQVLLDRTEEANRFLYLAIDQTMDPNIESSAYCLLGSNHLTGGDLENAIRTSRRGLAISVTPKQKQVASIVLARAYLLNNKPYSANHSLFRNHESFEDPEAQAAAAVLGAYARYIGIKEKRGIETARNRLMTALAMMPNEDYVSFADCYIACQAYEKLGFRDKAIEKIILALAQSDVGVWRRQLIFDLAVLQKRDGQLDEATAAFLTLIQIDDTWTTLALEQLGRIYFETDQTERCIQICKRLWQSELTEEQKRTALQLLGSAFQKQGEHHSAALCFAGMLPDSL